jgi:L-alanine-DL-glutamate epimerase-like enolase superfamily enzyme
MGSLIKRQPNLALRCHFNNIFDPNNCPVYRWNSLHKCGRQTKACGIMIALHSPVRAALVLLAMVVPMLAGDFAGASVTIRQVRLIDYKIPRTKNFVTSKGVSDSCYGIFILLSADDDSGHHFTALGDVLERSLVTNETSADAWAGANAMAPELPGKVLTGDDQAADLAAVRQWLATLSKIANEQTLTTRKPPPPGKQLRATLCGFDIALLDLLGQVYDKPIYEILGGAKRKDVTVSAMTFNADDSLAQLADEVDQSSDSFGSMRLKIGLDDGQDIEKLRTVAMGLKDKPQVNIWVDANQSWKNSDKSIAMLQRVRDALNSADFKATFICEQPTLGTDIPALAAVTAEIHKWRMPFKIVIMADEAMWTLDDTRQIVAQHACDLVNIKIQKSGGLLASKDIADYLATADPDMGIYIGGVIATDVTSWANLQLCYAVPRLDYATSCIPRRAYKVNVASVPIEYRTGKTMVYPTAPGLGTGLDLGKLKGFIHRDAQIPTTQPAG